LVGLIVRIRSSSVFGLQDTKKTAQARIARKKTFVGTVSAMILFQLNGFLLKKKWKIDSAKIYRVNFIYGIFVLP
jgi:hypothetical protein